MCTLERRVLWWTSTFPSRSRREASLLVGKSRQRLASVAYLVETCEGSCTGRPLPAVPDFQRHAPLRGLRSPDKATANIVEVHESPSDKKPFQQLQRDEENHRREIQTCHQWEYLADRRKGGLSKGARNCHERVSPIERYPRQNDSSQDHEGVEIDESCEERHEVDCSSVTVYLTVEPTGLKTLAVVSG